MQQKNYFNRNLQSLEQKFLKAEEVVASIGNDLEKITDNGFKDKDLLKQLAMSSKILATQIDEVFNQYQFIINNKMLKPEMSYAMGAVCLVLLMLIIYKIYFTTNFNLKLSRQQQRENNESISKLINEISSLARGDLTISATISDNITGAIAETVNYSINALRKLVTTINHASSKVSSSINRSRITVENLSVASKNQDKPNTRCH